MSRNSPPPRRATGRPRSKSAAIGSARFFAAARQWDAATVAAAIRAEPELARLADRRGRTALHLVAAVDVRTSRRPASASVATSRELLTGGADIDAVHPIPDHDERFPAHPLWHAVARGRNRTLARFLLKRGADPNWCYWAVVWADDVITARLLQSHGADVNLTFHGETPLLYATRLRRTRMMKWLLAHGADVNLPDGDGRSPLHHAVGHRHTLAEIELLLQHGAVVSQVANDGSTPVLVAGARLARVLGSHAASREQSTT